MKYRRIVEVWGVVACIEAKRVEDEEDGQIYLDHNKIKIFTSIVCIGFML
jgi:hypothetical protein